MAVFLRGVRLSHNVHNARLAIYALPSSISVPRRQRQSQRSRHVTGKQHVATAEKGGNRIYAATADETSSFAWDDRGRGLTAERFPVPAVGLTGCFGNSASNCASGQQL